MLSGADTELSTGWMLQGWRQHRGRQEETALGNQDEEKAMGGPGSPTFLPSPRCKVESGEGMQRDSLGAYGGLPEAESS